MDFHRIQTEKSAATKSAGRELTLEEKQLLSLSAYDYTVQLLQKWSWAHISNENNLDAESIRDPKKSEELRMIRGLYDRIQSEKDWWESGRPFYNVWPITYGIIDSLQIDIPWSEVRLPAKSIALCFPNGKEPLGLGASLIVQTNGGLFVRFQCANADMGCQTTFFPNDATETVDETLSRHQSGHGEFQGQEGEEFTIERELFLLRLAVFIGVLHQRDREEVITPIVLGRDESKYNTTIEEELRRKLIDKASKLQGKGFNVGKKLDHKRSASPHFRKPHLAKYWIGEGRSQLAIIMRAGAIVMSKKLSEVPTGFLGPETTEEFKAAETIHCRANISKRTRFLILRRDGYKCQICGLGAPQGVTLEIDHKVAVSQGGSSETDNLWVLCFDCNRGKSNLNLCE